MRHAFVALAAAALALLGMLAAGELLVRAAGRTPWRPLEVDRDEPTAHEPDPVLGWRARPGSHVFPPRSPGAGPVRMTFHEEGDRAAGDPAPGVSRVLLFVGGSYTQGWAVSDGQSFPALLQERFPTWRVENFGTAAYGTYQSLLVLEERVRLGDPVRAVVYGFIADHERRNVADPLWLKTLSLLSRRGAVDVPYCTIDDEGELVRHPPARHPQWPLHERLATIALLEDAVALRCGRHRSSSTRWRAGRARACSWPCSTRRRGRGSTTRSSSTSTAFPSPTARIRSRPRTGSRATATPVPAPTPATPPASATPSSPSRSPLPRSRP